MTAPFRLRVHGRAGHASMPAIADNALVKAPLDRADRALSPEPQIGPEVEAFLGAARRGAAGRRGGSARVRLVARRGASSSPARPDLLADDDLRAREAERHPGALRGRGRLPALPGPDPEHVEP
jgi:hypothetical protein